MTKPIASEVQFLEDRFSELAAQLGYDDAALEQDEGGAEDPMTSEKP